MESLKEKRMEKTRGVTPKALLESALKDVNEYDIDDVVIVMKRSDGAINTGYSYTGSLIGLGLLEIAKDVIKEDMVD